MSLKLKKIGGIIFVFLLILAFFVVDLRREPIISIIMVLSLVM